MGTCGSPNGYGESLVHRFSADGVYLGSLTGEEGAGRFDCPHAAFVDRRREPELYVADRANARIQVFDLDGAFKRVVGEGELSGPTWFAPWQGLLFVVENWPARITVLDVDDRVVGRLCENAGDFDREDWPNTVDETGIPRRYTGLRPGLLNSPHAVAVDDGAACT